MKSFAWRVAILLLAVMLVASTADAQRRARRRAAAAAALERPSFGAHLGYNFDASDVLLGAQANIPITPRVAIYPSFDYYFQDVGTLWALNGDVKFHPPTRSGFFYVGGGLNILHSSGNNDTNLNLLAGLEGRRWRHTIPYVELKVMVGDGSAVQLVGGFSWRSR